MKRLSVNALAQRVPAHHRGTAALLLVILACLGIQISTAVAAPLLDRISPLSLAGLRSFCAAIVLLILVRPRVSKLKKSDWPQVILYGVVVTFLNIGYFSAIKYIPLGIAVTIEFLGAFGVSLLGVQRTRDGLISLGALAGVILIAGPSFESTQIVGYLWAAMSALCMAGYTLLSARMGHGSPAVEGLKGLAISICISALLLSPLSVPVMGEIGWDGWLRVALAGSMGIALAYSSDAVAARLTSAAVIGVLLSLDPVVGALIGTVVMGQVLPLPAYLGILLIAASGALLVWKTNRSAIAISAHHPNTAILDAIVEAKTGQLPIIHPEDH